MKIIVLILSLFISPIVVLAQESILGHWNTGQENTVIEIQETEGKMEGRIISSDNPKAPVGKLILKDLYSDKNLLKGKLYSPKRDRWFDASFSPSLKEMEVIISAGWVKQQVNWTKLQ